MLNISTFSIQITSVVLLHKIHNVTMLCSCMWTFKPISSLILSICFSMTHGPYVSTLLDIPAKQDSWALLQNYWPNDQTRVWSGNISNRHPICILNFETHRLNDHFLAFLTNTIFVKLLHKSLPGSYYKLYIPKYTLSFSSSSLWF